MNLLYENFISIITTRKLSQSPYFTQAGGAFWGPTGVVLGRILSNANFHRNSPLVVFEFMISNYDGYFFIIQIIFNYIKLYSYLRTLFW